MRKVCSPIGSAELRARAARAREMLRACEMCEKRCGVDRACAGSDAAGRAPCLLGDATWCFKRHVSYAEELELLPSYMVYFGGCNFRCRFCVQGPTCFAPKVGVEVRAEEAARDFARVVGKGARTINLLGGEPSLHLHTILEIAAAHAERIERGEGADGEPLPLVLNSNMYMTPEVIELLDGVVVLYIADFKFGGDACARTVAGVERYVEVVTRNLLHAAGSTPLIVRHLLMPGHVECCLKPVAAWMAEHLPATAFTLMTGYVPAWRAGKDDALGRTLTSAEIQEAEAYVRRLGLRRAA